MHSVPKRVAAAIGGVLLLCLATAPRAAAVESLAGRHVIHDGGQPREFEVATDELQVAGKSARRVRLPVQPSAEAIRHQAEALALQTGEEFSLVLYERGVPHNEFTRRILTRQTAVRLAEGASPIRLGRIAGAAVLKPVTNLPGWFLAASPAVDGALALATRLRHEPGVLFAEPQLARLHQPKWTPNDPLFPTQWHLLNTGQGGAVAGIDLNVTGTWNTRRGAGIVIGIVDDGLQISHPDLSPNIAAGLSWDFNFNDPDPSPDPAYDIHGTKVAGVAAARGDNALGVAGVAHESAIAGLRLLGAADTDAQDAAAMLHSNAVIHIKNNSWGAFDGGGLSGAGPLMSAALAQGVATGRGGRGEIYVFAGGNGLSYGDDVNYDGFANSVHVIAVGAVNDQGQQSSYSEPGACLVVSAPSSSAGRQGITTTDLTGSSGTSATDYLMSFGGTSAATPQVSGVIALMLQANANLNYRDVKEVLLRSATKVSPFDADWSINAAGIAHNHKFGGGLVNAGAAVALAGNWLSLGPASTVSLAQTNLNLAVPDNDALGLTRTFTVTNAGFRVETVALNVTLPHEYFGDLAVTLTSPSGTQSRLAERHSSLGSGYNGWALTSVRHWGEPANGTWTVRVADMAPGNTGTLSALQLVLHGSSPETSLAATKATTNLLLTLQAPAVAWKYVVQISTNLTAWSDFETLQIGPDGTAAVSVTNSPTPAFFRARLAP